MHRVLMRGAIFFLRRTVTSEIVLALTRHREACFTDPAAPSDLPPVASVPTSSPSPVTIALITAGAAFSASVGAQILAHVFTLRRDHRTYARGVYEKLYAPVIFDVLLYVDAHRHYTGAHGIVTGIEERLLKRVVDHVAEHLSLASPQLISAFYNMRRHFVHDADMVGYGREIEERSFLLTFLRDYERTVDRLGSVDKEQKRQIAGYIDLCRIWVIASRLYRDGRTDILLQHTWLLDHDRMGAGFRRKLARWQKTVAPLGEGGPDLIEGFEEFLIEHAGREGRARETLRDAFAQQTRRMPPC